MDMYQRLFCVLAKDKVYLLQFIKFMILYKINSSSINSAYAAKMNHPHYYSLG